MDGNTFMNEKRRIVFLLSGYGVYRRGAELLLEQLGRSLEGPFEITILARGRAGVMHVPALSRSNGFLRLLDRCPGVGHALRFLHLGPLNVEWLTACVSALPWLLRNRYDLFVPEGGLWGGLTGRLIRRAKGVPFVDIAHGALSKWELAAARQRPDCYVTSTRVTTDAIASHVPGLRTAVIPPGVDASLFCPDGPKATLPLDPPVVVCVGALEAVKRVELAIRAVADWGKGSLLLVGEGPLQSDLLRMGQQLLGSRRFRRMDAPHADMPSLYRAADVFTSASRSEAFGMVYLEAMACGLPVVSQDDPIRREVVGRAGVLCECANIREYASALDAAASLPAGEAPRPRALRFTWDSAAEAYRALFEDLIAASARV